MFISTVSSSLNNYLPKDVINIIQEYFEPSDFTNIKTNVYWSNRLYLARRNCVDILQYIRLFNKDLLNDYKKLNILNIENDMNFLVSQEQWDTEDRKKLILSDTPHKIHITPYYFREIIEDEDEEYRDYNMYGQPRGDPYHLNAYYLNDFKDDYRLYLSRYKEVLENFRYYFSFYRKKNYTEGAKTKRKILGKIATIYKNLTANTGVLHP